MGGKFHLKLNIGSRPIANKYHEGKMKRTLKRELKVPEIAEREANGTSRLGEFILGITPWWSFTLLVIVGWEARITLGQWQLARGCVKLLSRTHLPTALRVTRTTTKWFPSTRLETRTKESNICASSRVVKPEKRSESDCWDFCTSNRPIDREWFEYEHIC